MPALNTPKIKCTEKGEVLSQCNHVEQLPQTSYDMHSPLGAGEGTKPQASH